MPSSENPDNESEQAKQKSAQPTPVPTESRNPLVLDENDKNNGNNCIPDSGKASPNVDRRIEWAQLVVNGVLVVVGIIAVCIYGCELSVMKGQLGEVIRQYPQIQKQAQAATDAVNLATTQAAKNTSIVATQLAFAQKQAKAAEDSVKTAQRQTWQEQRAWVSVDVGAPDGNFSVAMHNTGKPPAVHVTYSVGFTPGSLGVIPDLESDLRKNNSSNLPEFPKNLPPEVMENLKNLDSLANRRP